MISAGALDQRILITSSWTQQNRLGETVPDDGNGITEFVSASVRQQSNAEQVRNGINTSLTTYSFRIRYIDDVPSSGTISYRGKTLDILSITEVGNRDALDIVAVLQNGRAV